MAELYESLDQKPYESQYLFFERVYDFDIETMWPHTLAISAWMTDHRLVTIGGTPGEVGHIERVYVQGLGEDVPEPHYHVYGIAHLVPPTLIALEYFPEIRGSYGETREKLGFDMLLLSDVGDNRTKLTFLVIEVQLGRAAEGAQAEHDDGTLQGRINRYFDNLQRVIEGSQ
jgi:hypothetical protein